MANSSKPFAYFILVSLLANSIFINPASCDLKTHLLIEDICNQIENFTFCSGTFEDHMIDTADSADLAQIALQVAINKAFVTHNTIVEFLKNTTEPAEKNALTVCENAYRLVMDNLDKAKIAFFDGKYDDMVDFEEPAVRAQASCITIFETPPNPPNHIERKNTHNKMYIAMAVIAGTKLTSVKRG